MERQDTYARSYSQLLAEHQRPSTDDDYAIACILAANERDALQPLEPRPDSSLDGQLALQLHEQEANKLLHPRSKRSRGDRAFRKLLKTLNITQVIPRLNPCFFPDDSYISQDRQRLLLRLDMYALQERQVVGDGNCQFRAIADQLHWNQDLHQQVRQRVVEQLCRCPERYKDYVPTDYQQYVSSMSQSGTWGDHVTLQAAADVFAVRVCIVSSFLENSVISIDPCIANSDQQGSQQQQQQHHQQQPRLAQCLWLSFWAEVHYNSLVAKAPASPNTDADDSDSSSSGEAGSSHAKLLGSRKLRQAADKLF